VPRRPTPAPKTPKLLDAEIDKERNNLRTDKLDISYGELGSLYESGELIIAPDYQRFFRWSADQKANFLESLLLGFPVPAIFVAESDNGIWELVDGLQRVSTVFEFFGILKNADETSAPPSQISFSAKERQKLPHLDGYTFEELSLRSRLAIRRLPCRVEVIKVGSAPQMKYDVFERLNTGGSGLEPQEIRNAIFRASDPDFMTFCDKLAEFPAFTESLLLSEAQGRSMYDKGLVLRFFTLKNNYEKFDHDVEPFITSYVKEIVTGQRKFDRVPEKKIFNETFKAINGALGEDAFRHLQNGRQVGAFSVYVFDALSIGVAKNIGTVKTLTMKQVKERCLAVKAAPDFKDNVGAGGNTHVKMRARLQAGIRIIGRSA
jgi:hypothetical protein